MERVLQPQGIENHERLDGLSKADLVGNQMPDPAIGQDALNIGQLMGIRSGRHAHRSAETGDFAFDRAPKRLNPEA